MSRWMDSLLAPSSTSSFHSLNNNSNSRIKHKSLSSGLGFFNLRKFSTVSFGYSRRSCRLRLSSSCRSKIKCSTSPTMSSSASPEIPQPKIVNGPGGYVLEDVPHLSDYIPDLAVRIIYFSLIMLIKRIGKAKVRYLLKSFSHSPFWATNHSFRFHFFIFISSVHS